MKRTANPELVNLISKLGVYEALLAFNNVLHDTLEEVKADYNKSETSPEQFFIEDCMAHVQEHLTSVQDMLDFLEPSVLSKK